MFSIFYSLVLQSNFFLGISIKTYRIRREIKSSTANKSQGSPSSALLQSHNVNYTIKLTENVTTPIPLQSSTPTLPPLPPPSPVPFLPDNSDANITMHCEGYWFSCRGRCTQERELGGTVERLQCFCDISCEFFQDCCADFDQYCSSSRIPAQETITATASLWECVEDFYLPDFRGVWMISSCPESWTHSETKEQCRKFRQLSYENHKDCLPVIDQKGNTYRNHYCAECHGVTLDELAFYNLQFKCDVPVPKAYKESDILKFLFDVCKTSFWNPPKGVARRYCHQIASRFTCFSWPPTKAQGKCYTAPVRLVYPKFPTTSAQNYFNPYCAICSSKKNITCGPGKARFGGDPPGLAKPFSLVMSLDFSDDDIHTSQIRKHNVSCYEGEVYDFHLQVCRPGITPSQLNSRRLKIFSVGVWMRSKVPSWRPVVNEMNFKKAMVNKLHINEPLLSNIHIGNPFGSVSTVMFNINVDPAMQKNFSITALTTEMKNLSIKLNDVNFTFFKIAFKSFHCAIIENFPPNRYTIERNTVKIKATKEVFQETDFYTNETAWINGSLVPIGTISVCKQPSLNCSGVLVGLAEYEYVVLSNGSLYRNISGDLFENGRFQLINDTVWVCAKFSPIYEESFTEVSRNSTDSDIVLVVLTYIGLSLSILSFVLVLVTYSLFKELRTLPGINLMNLCFAHLLVDLLYFATGYIKAKVACTVIAVLLHYFFLASFMWMSIIAFETWQIFSKLRIQDRIRSKRKKCFRLLRRFSLGWLCVLGFVVVCVALNQSNTVTLQYGGTKGCWINNAYANLFFFGLPVALSLSFNVIFFALTVRAIRKTNNQTRRVTQNHQTATVFLKIFILMGFTWVFGFLNVLVSHYFQYPFIIFTTLQGLYVALAFVFTTRVKQMYYMLLCKKNNSITQNKNAPCAEADFTLPVILLSHKKQNEK